MKSSGQNVVIKDVSPMTEEDPQGTSLSVLALPMAFGGMASAMVFSRTVKRRGMRLAGALLFSVFGGLAVGAVLQFGFDIVDGNYWEFSGMLALVIAATNMFVLGLESLFGMAGFGIGAILTMFFSNPLSGIATDWHWVLLAWVVIGGLLTLLSSRLQHHHDKKDEAVNS